MKITFIDPSPKFGGYNFGWLKTMPLVGQIYLATILRKAGHTVEIIKENLQKIDFSKLKDTEIFCISCMSSQAVRAREIVKELKNRFPKKKVIVGGVHASFRPQDFPEADYVVIGESELIIEKLINSIEKINNRIVYGKPVENLDELPFPDYSLTNKINSLRFTPVSTSRGCPFDCKFCSVTQMFGKRYRFRTPESVVKEIQSIKRLKNLMFYDDNFCAHKQRVKDILKLMIETKTTPKWWGEARVDIARDDELLKLIAESNNLEIAIGFESINPKILKSMNKGQGLKDIAQCIKKAKDYGIKIKGFFIGGNDFDNKNVYRDILDFVDKNELDSATFSILTPLPGTDIFDNFDKQKRILHKDWSAYDVQHVVIRPKNMSAYTLQKEQLKALGTYYRENLRWAKFVLGNIWDVSNIYREFKLARKLNLEYLDFLARFD